MIIASSVQFDVHLVCKTHIWGSILLYSNFSGQKRFLFFVI